MAVDQYLVYILLPVNETLLFVFLWKLRKIFSIKEKKKSSTVIDWPNKPKENRSWDHLLYVIGCHCCVWCRFKNGSGSGCKTSQVLVADVPGVFFSGFSHFRPTY